VEFLAAQAIRDRYGAGGIVGFAAWGAHPAGSYTDDTQMSLATAYGLLDAFRRQALDGTSDPVSSVHTAYLAWLSTQSDPRTRRAPGRTCLSALESGRRGAIGRPLNDSKGCGGVMRTAPAGLAFPAELAFQYGAEFAALTHGHPSGYLTGGYMAELVARLVEGTDLAAAVTTVLESLAAYEGHEETLERVRLAQVLAGSGEAPHEAIARLGLGWVGEEALAIAVYCALCSPADFRQAVTWAVNHSGDSDSTGSICGAMVGASLGAEGIPLSWRETVESHAEMSQLADTMHSAFVRGRVPDSEGGTAHG
jgi:ADP-ribosylglycohydrolase